MLVFFVLCVSYSIFLQAVSNDVLHCYLREGKTIRNNFTCTKNYNSNNNSSVISQCDFDLDTLFINCSYITITIADGSKFGVFYLKKYVGDSGVPLSSNYQLILNKPGQTSLDSLCKTIRCKLSTDLRNITDASKAPNGLLNYTNVTTRPTTDPANTRFTTQTIEPVTSNKAIDYTITIPIKQTTEKIPVDATSECTTTTKTNEQTTEQIPADITTEYTKTTSNKQATEQIPADTTTEYTTTTTNEETTEKTPDDATNEYTTTEQTTTTSNKQKTGPMTPDASTESMTLHQGWITSDQRQLQAVYNVSSYYQAENDCQTLHQASLVMFASPLTYLNLTRTLNLTDEVFWVADLLNIIEINLNDSSAMCLLLKVLYNTSILLAKPCSELHFSICSRSITDEILNQPEFEEMIQSMTVDKRQTARSRRQRQSAEDNRVVSKALGRLCIGIICVVLGLVMLMDLPRLLHWCRCRCRCERKISRDKPLNTLENRQNKCTRL